MSGVKSQSVISRPEKATTPKITNKVLPTADTEESHPFESGLQKFTIRTRGEGELKFAFDSGDSGTTYISVPGCSGISESDLDLSGVTIYMQSPVAGEIVEILEWT